MGVSVQARFRTSTQLDSNGFRVGYAAGAAPRASAAAFIFNTSGRPRAAPAAGRGAVSTEARSEHQGEAGFTNCGQSAECRVQGQCDERCGLGVGVEGWGLGVEDDPMDTTRSSNTPHSTHPAPHTACPTTHCPCTLTSRNGGPPMTPRNGRRTTIPRRHRRPLHSDHSLALAFSRRTTYVLCGAVCGARRAE